MLPTPDAPFAQVPDHWDLEARCPCKITTYNAAYRRRHFPPTMTARKLVARLRCAKCGQRPHAAEWQDGRLGPGGKPLHPEARVPVLGE